MDFCVVDLDRQGQGQVRVFSDCADFLINKIQELKVALRISVSWTTVLWIWIARGRAK